MTWIVLIPCPLGYCLFVQWPRQRLRSSSSILHPTDLRDAVGAFDDPVKVVLVGSRHADEVAREILAVGDLIVVPEAWVRGPPTHAFSKRADLALRAARAHTKAALELRRRTEEQLELF